MPLNSVLNVEDIIKTENRPLTVRIVLLIFTRFAGGKLQKAVILLKAEGI